MYQKRRIHTVVITKNDVKKTAVFLGMCAIAVICGAAAVLARYLPPPSPEAGINIAKKGMHSDGADISDIPRMILGFDAKREESIIGRFYKGFFKEGESVAAEESAPPQITDTKESAAVAVTEEKIAEVNAAKGMKISNLAGLEVNVEKLLSEPLNNYADTNGAQVLIMHTHTTESYSDSVKYSGANSDRSTDSEKNMVAVGEVIKDVLAENGIETVHDATVHDYPSYNGAYTRAMTTIKNNLAKYPNIKFVLDVHRDGIVKEDGTKVKVATEINGEKSAQCMFVIGSNVKLKHDAWQENMKLACKLQKYANDNYPGLMRPIILRKERFNQQVSQGAVIIEIGSNGNTLDEAKTGAKYIANTIAAVIKKEG